MSKTLKEAQVTTREARKRLAPGLYWRSVDGDIHLGYRKGKRGGVWLVRWRNGSGYRQAPLGLADDILANGNLDFRTAVRVAAERVTTIREQARTSPQAAQITVRSAVDAYVNLRNARQSRRTGRIVRSDAAHRLERYVIGRPSAGRRQAMAASTLADVGLHELTERHLRDWRQGLPQRLKATTVQRLVSDLKSALNEAADAEKDRLPATLPSVIRSGLKAPPLDDDEDIEIARENQILSDMQIRAVLRAARDVDAELGFEGDLYRLLAVMAATGSRFCQVARLRVIDVQVEAGRLMIPTSRKGRGKKSSLTPVPIGGDVLQLIGPILVNRQPQERLLQRWRFEQRAGPVRWHRSERGEWRTPSEIVRPWGLIRERVGSPEVVPYALRHSSIVRSIRANLPLRLVAAIHDTSVTMIERHYARYIADGLDDLAAKAIVPLLGR